MNQGERTPEGQARQVAAVTKHGHAKGEKQSPEYRAWADMKNRCYQPNNKNYRFYGARGITVCQRWSDSFSDFLYDMGPRPSKKHSIGRMKNELGYSPDNCRWETREEQDNNKTDSVFLEYKGERLTLAQWARKFGHSRNTINSRYRRGWSDAQIIEGIAPCGRKLPQKDSKRSSHVQAEPKAE